ncbi:hypothetical protein F5Y18DRAFT_404338 [Xylariaceae sp. FL1019]|nr:hypothetical protein F5Y18DRAFT_404338 [Xylariaceae sp. FL1019]
MSLAVLRAGHLKPEVRLMQSIDQFQSSLSQEQQAAFLAGRSTASQSCPGVRDVMHITAEIDRQARLRNGGGQRCYGPRMVKALESVQQFVSVGDVLIGGSQNLIASGVWSIVRLSLLATSRLSTYLEKLSELFMAVGSSAPRYQEMISLYPRSKPLRQLGIEYQITLVNLCCFVITSCNKSTRSQLKGIFKDIDFSSYKSELLKWSEAIKEQLHLEEAKGNSRLRTRFHEVVAIESVQKDLNRLSACLDACSTYDYQAAWNRIRSFGDATWFFDHKHYNEWKMATESSLMMITAKLGAGKSITLASILDDILLNIDDCLVSYFFCQPDDSESLTQQTVIGCLARQILHTVKPHEFRYDHTAQKARFSIQTVKDLISRNIAPSTQVFLVLDGIEACQEHQRRQVILFLKWLQSCTRAKLCLSRLSRL